MKNSRCYHVLKWIDANRVPELAFLAVGSFGVIRAFGYLAAAVSMLILTKPLIALLCAMIILLLVLLRR